MVGPTPTGSVRGFLAVGSLRGVSAGLARPAAAGGSPCRRGRVPSRSGRRGWGRLGSCTDSAHNADLAAADGSPSWPVERMSRNRMLGHRRRLVGFPWEPPILPRLSRGAIARVELVEPYHSHRTNVPGAAERRHGAVCLPTWTSYPVRSGWWTSAASLGWVGHSRRNRRRRQPALHEVPE